MDSGFPAVEARCCYALDRHAGRTLERFGRKVPSTPLLDAESSHVRDPHDHHPDGAFSAISLAGFAGAMTRPAPAVVVIQESFGASPR